MWKEFEDEHNDSINAREEIIKDRDKTDLSKISDQMNLEIQETHPGKINNLKEKEEVDEKTKLETKMIKENQGNEQTAITLIEPEIDKIYEALQLGAKLENMDLIIETERNLTKEKKTELIKWADFRKFQEQLETREKENLETKERERIKLLLSTKESKLLDKMGRNLGDI
jgi:hypothetical protein